MSSIRWGKRNESRPLIRVQVEVELSEPLPGQREIDLAISAIGSLFRQHPFVRVQAVDVEGDEDYLKETFGPTEIGESHECPVD